ncbi:hypothetical protein ACHAPU_009708 [Fusarium lateritium]
MLAIQLVSVLATRYSCCYEPRSANLDPPPPEPEPVSLERLSLPPGVSKEPDGKDIRIILAIFTARMFDELSILRTVWAFRRVVLVALAVYTGYVCEGFELKIGNNIIANAGFIKEFGHKGGSGVQALDPTWIRTTYTAFFTIHLLTLLRVTCQVYVMEICPNNIRRGLLTFQAVWYAPPCSGSPYPLWQCDGYDFEQEYSIIEKTIRHERGLLNEAPKVAHVFKGLNLV